MDLFSYENSPKFRLCDHTLKLISQPLLWFFESIGQIKFWYYCKIREILGGALRRSYLNKIGLSQARFSELL